MNPTLRAYRQKLEEFIASVDSFPLTKREEVLFWEWTLKDLLVHLAGWARWQEQVISALAEGRILEEPRDLKVSINEKLVADRKGWPWSRVYKEFIEATARLVSAYNELPTRRPTGRRWLGWLPLRLLQVDFVFLKNHAFGEEEFLLGGEAAFAGIAGETAVGSYDTMTGDSRSMRINFHFYRRGCEKTRLY